MSLLLHFVRRTALLLFLLGLSSMAFAQPPSDEFEFDDIPLDEGELPYIGVGGGYVGMLSFMNFDELNKFNKKLGMDEFTAPLIMHGGGGWTVIGLIPNLRLGVYGAGGSTTKTEPVTIGGTEYTRTVRFDAGFTAAHIDYAIPLFRGFAAVPGFMIGSGSNSYKVVQTQTTGAHSGNFFGGFGGYHSDSASAALAGQNRSSTMERSFLFLYPSVNLEYAITQFVMIRVGGGYQLTGLTSDPKWLDTEGTEIKNDPSLVGDATIPDLEKIKSDGPMVQIGVFLGLFQQ